MKLGIALQIIGWCLIVVFFFVPLAGFVWGESSPLRPLILDYLKILIPCSLLGFYFEVWGRDKVHQAKKKKADQMVSIAKDANLH